MMLTLILTTQIRSQSVRILSVRSFLWSKDSMNAIMRVESLLGVTASTSLWLNSKAAQWWSRRWRTNRSSLASKFGAAVAIVGIPISFRSMKEKSLGKSKEDLVITRRSTLDRSRFRSGLWPVLYEHCPPGSAPREWCQRRWNNSSKSGQPAHHDEEWVGPAAGRICSQVGWWARNMPKENLRMERH